MININRILLVLFLLSHTVASPLYELTAQPGEVKGLILWLDGDDIDADGVPEGLGEAGLIDGKVNIWYDKSGCGNNAVQSLTQLMPSYKTGILNDRSVVGLADGQFFDLDITSAEHTLFIVTRTGPLPIVQNFGTLFVMNDGGVGLSNPNKRQPMLFLRDNNRIGLSYNDKYGVHHSYNFQEFSGFGLISLSKGHKKLQSCLNGQMVFSGEFEQDEVDGVDSIGRNVLNGSTYKGDIAEIILYNRALEDFEHQQVGFYLQSKYGFDWGFEEQFLVFDNAEKVRLAQAKKAGLIEIEPVILPNEQNVLMDNDHFGWPVAAMSGNNIVVHCQQNLSHYTNEEKWGSTKNQESIGFIVRSNDCGQTWQQPKYIKDMVSSSTGPNAAGMISIGTDAGGAIILKHSYYPHGGCLYSPNGGSFWQHFPSAFSNLTTSRSNIGPRIIVHPVFGLMMFCGQSVSGSNPILRSQNSGQTWEDRYWFDAVSIPAEPTAVTFDGNILLISREFGSMVDSDNRYQMLSQHFYRYEAGDNFNDISFITDRTNVRGNLYSGPRAVWAHDTADVSVNPYTDRIELTDSHRWGGGLGNTGDAQPTDRSSLNIWSISKDELIAGSSKWRFDGTLLSRSRSSHHGSGFADGLHPGAAVIDQVGKVQHIFVYAGFSDRRTGIYRITRTLDTNRLRRWLLNKFSTIWRFDPEYCQDDQIIDATGYMLNGSIIGGSTFSDGPAEYGFNSCMVFGGSNHIKYSDGGDAFFDISSEKDLAIEILFKTASDGNLAVKKLPEGSGWQIGVRDGRLCFTVDGESASAELHSSSLVNDNRWHHLVINRQKNILQLYLDYKIEAMSEISVGSLENDADLLLGYDFTGKIALFRYSRDALSVSEFTKPVDSRGDVNCDGIVDDLDIDIVSGNLGTEKTDMGIRVGDLDMDGDVDGSDLEFVIGKIGEGRLSSDVEDLVVCFDSRLVKYQNGIMVWPDLAIEAGGNDAIISSGMPVVIQAPLSDRNINQVVHFDGNVKLKLHPLEDLDRKNLSCFVLLRPQTGVDNMGILSFNYDDIGNGLTGNDLFGLSVEQGIITSYVRNIDGQKVVCSGIMADGQWIVVSLIWDAGNLAMYVDGRLVCSADGINADPFYNQNVSIGMTDNIGGFEGDIANILIYNAAIDEHRRVKIESFLGSGCSSVYNMSDTNNDCRIDFVDFKSIYNYWNNNCSYPDRCWSADIDWDGMVSISDLYMIINEWITIYE